MYVFYFLNPLDQKWIDSGRFHPSCIRIRGVPSENTKLIRTTSTNALEINKGAPANICHLNPFTGPDS